MEQKFQQEISSRVGVERHLGRYRHLLVHHESRALGRSRSRGRPRFWFVGSWHDHVYLLSVHVELTNRFVHKLLDVDPSFNHLGILRVVVDLKRRLESHGRVLLHVLVQNLHRIDRVDPEILARLLGGDVFMLVAVHHRELVKALIQTKPLRTRPKRREFSSMAAHKPMTTENGTTIKTYVAVAQIIFIYVFRENIFS